MAPGEIVNGAVVDDEVGLKAEQLLAPLEPIAGGGSADPEVEHLEGEVGVVLPEAALEDRRVGLVVRPPSHRGGAAQADHAQGARGLLRGEFAGAEAEAVDLDAVAIAADGEVEAGVGLVLLPDPPVPPERPGGGLLLPGVAVEAAREIPLG